ncbi:hypothetical protein BGW80DRAFT_1333510 [Lactifluus volemus]|nr:hypothetical protein BGW80DRAFT_1333510 [Lactifluus volemus]
MALSFASSEIIALCLESVLYGIYFVLFLACIKVLIGKRRRRSSGNYRLVIVSSVLFVLITWHEILDAVRLFLAYRGSETDQGADLYYSRVTAMPSVMKTALYRCYVVWNLSIPVIILPTLLYVADIGTGIAAVYTLTLIRQDIVFNLEQERITNAFFSCTLAVNALCTGLIAFRIWRTQMQTRDAKMGSSLMHVSIIVIESGAVYLSILACVVASFTVKSLLFNIFLDIFSLIIVRIGLGVSSDEPRPENNSMSYSMPSKMNTRASKGPIIFRSTTTTQFVDGPDSETTFKESDSEGTFKMALRGDSDKLRIDSDSATSV